MLTVDLGTIEHFDPDKNEFVYETGGVVRFEYSLKAVYEWEGKWKKPFLKGELTYIEAVDLYKFMALDKFDEKFLNEDVIKILSDYIMDPSTATTFAEVGGPGTNATKVKKHTSEEIYAMMFSAGLPLEFENRNLNRLLTILKVISIQNNPPKAMSKNDIMRQNQNLNRQRKEQMKTRG